MPVESHRHAAIAGNIGAAIRETAPLHAAYVHVGSARVWIEEANVCYCPDVVVSGGPGNADIAERPLLIVEVLSDRTEATDRREKRVNYLRVASIQEYVLVSQNERSIELYRRDGDQWNAEITDDGEVLLEAVGAVLRLDEVYR